MTVVWIILILVVFFGIFAFTGAPYVPSHRKELQNAFTVLYKLKPSDVVVDLGSGDGVVVRMAARYSNRVIGIELNPVLVLISKMLSRTNHEKYIVEDIWKYKFPEDTTVVYAFSVSRDVNKLQRKIEKHTKRTGLTVSCILYGPSFKNKEPIKTLGAHYLYVFNP